MTKTACVPWSKYLRESGYGQRYFRGTTMLAHRAVWIERFGPIPNGLEVDHVCKNRSCVNTKHLRLLTHAANMRFSQHSHCIRGHLFTKENAYHRKDGGRNCRTCHRERMANIRATDQEGR